MMRPVTRLPSLGALASVRRGRPEPRQPALAAGIGGRATGFAASGHHPRQRGLTLIELMVTIGVLMILSTVGVPSFQTMLHNNRVAIVANDLTFALTLARSEAVRRGAGVQVCASADGMTCAGAWSDGWIVAPLDRTEDEPPLRAWGAQPRDLGPTEQGDLTEVTFSGLGAASSNGAAFVIGDSSRSGQRARLIDVAPCGRLALKPYPS